MNHKLYDTHEVFDPIINSKLTAYKYWSLGKFLKTPKGMIAFQISILNQIKVFISVRLKLSRVNIIYNNNEN